MSDLSAVCLMDCKIDVLCIMKTMSGFPSLFALNFAHIYLSIPKKVFVLQQRLHQAIVGAIRFKRRAFAEK